MTTTPRRPADTGHLASAAVIMVQYGDKYPQALSRLIATFTAIASLDCHFLVVDNQRDSDWHHQVNSRLSHIGGDNRAWEFSAFDRGRAFLEASELEPEIYVFATDALLAYGDDYLNLVDQHAIDVALTHRAVVGWMDSLEETCSIANLSYTSWLRTSLLIIPAERLPTLDSFVAGLDETLLFTDDPISPFRQDAPVSNNLQRFLRDWLTLDQEQAASDDRPQTESWHSKFVLDGDSFDFFRAKVTAILREHLLSARLQQAQVPAYDLRIIDQLVSRPGGDLISELAIGGERWLWLNWMNQPQPVPAREEIGELEQLLNNDPRQIPEPPTALFLVATAGDQPASLDAATFIVEHVLPLIRQRWSRTTIGVLASDLQELQSAELSELSASEQVVLIERPADLQAETSAPPLALLAPGTLALASFTALVERWPQLLVISPTRPAAASADASTWLQADNEWQFARQCCRLIERRQAAEESIYAT